MTHASSLTNSLTLLASYSLTRGHTLQARLLFEKKNLSSFNLFPQDRLPHSPQVHLSSLAASNSTTINNLGSRLHYIFYLPRVAAPSERPSVEARRQIGSWHTCGTARVFTVIISCWRRTTRMDFMRLLANPIAALEHRDCEHLTRTFKH